MLNWKSRKAAPSSAPPIAATVTADGFAKLGDAEMAQIAEQVVQSRMTQPDGPVAPVRSS